MASELVKDPTAMNLPSPYPTPYPCESKVPIPSPAESTTAMESRLC